ncbi:MAG: glycosyltransferase family 39 protein [Bacteroidetes bacterium]|nr:glycosyltransferase family 39 protein [Bacteroidota bacterium]
MKLKFKYFPEEMVLLLLILVATVLRFCCYSSFSYSNDELSALVRTQFPSFGELIRNGVLTDFHPAGIQIFLYYWTRLFGMSEAVVRLPFVIMGILTIPVAYSIGKHWFNKVTGLFFAAALTFLPFAILFSQIARPYGSGMLFSLIMVLFWTRMLFPNTGRRDVRHLPLAAGLTISASACMYNHYFSGLFAGLVALTGLFYLKKSNRMWYLGSYLVAALLFIPHIPVTLSHFRIGGVGEWLGKPGNNWIWKHIFYLFSQSWFLLIITLVLLSISIIINRKNLNFNKFHLFCGIFFLVPFLIGFFYSRWVNPVLQNTVLLFSSPFLLLFLFSFWKSNWNRTVLIILTIFTLSGICETVIIHPYYRKQHFGEFKDIARKVNEWNIEYGVDQITQVITVNNPFYINYYLKQTGTLYPFAQYDNRGGKDLLELVRIVNNCRTPYFISARTKFVPDEVPLIIGSKFPVIVKQIDYEGLSGITLYARKCPSGETCIKDSALLTVSNHFEGKDLWGMDPGKRITGFLSPGNHAIALDPSTEYGPCYQSVLQDITAWPFNTITIAISGMMADTASDAQIVADLTTSDGKSFAWASGNFNNFLATANPGQVYFVYHLPEGMSGKERLKVYIWNHGLKNVVVDDFTIKFYLK